MQPDAHTSKPVSICGFSARQFGQRSLQLREHASQTNSVLQHKNSALLVPLSSSKQTRHSRWSGAVSLASIDGAGGTTSFAISVSVSTCVASCVASSASSLVSESTTLTVATNTFAARRWRCFLARLSIFSDSLACLSTFETARLAHSATAGETALLNRVDRAWFI